MKRTYITPMPTATKADGIATWVYYTKARPADPFAFKKYYQVWGWEALMDPDHPLKLRV